ncbi:hypothetical protein [Duncaniella muricolitica]|uniref:hypothetical protein n=1 Tax=Duncaniella muricolitica TaxID=2880704 RepID=UPI00244DBF02|nr:hypothetical protein [Duncaniella muricolitica]
MVDSNKPIIAPRTTVVSNEQPAAPAGSAPAGGGTPPPAGGSSSSVTSTKVTTSTPISTTIPAEYSASSYEELIPQLEKRMAEFKPLSEEELKKLRRKQKIEGIISGVSDAAQSVANLIFTHHYAPNMYNPKEGMSAKAKERFDKEKAQRDADADKYLQYALTIGKMKDADKQRGLQAWQTEQTLARQDRAFDAGRQDRADDVAFRNKDYDERVRQWQANFDRQGEWHEEEGQRWERQFKESVRQFNVSAANERARINMESQRLAHSLKEGQMTFNLGSGNGNVTLTLDKLNAQTVSRIYHTLSPEVREKVQGDPIVRDGVVVGYKQPTTEAMLIAIGANVESSPATQNAIKQVAGLEVGNKPAGY